MKKYNFDEIVDRKGTDCIKYDALSHFFGTGDILPLWVADTDFRTPPFIMEAVRKRFEHEVLGYTFRSDSFFKAIISWVKERHGWEIEKDWIVFTPGVVSAITVAVMAFTRPGEKVVVQPPVYFPFFDCVTGTGRMVAENPLSLVNGRLQIDVDDLEKKTGAGTRMLLLCSPHNPGGMVWKKTELEAVAEICTRKNILVVSDEIHADLLFSGQKHTPWAMVSEQAASQSIVCMAPSKTFNIAGLSTSFVVIPDPELRQTFRNFIHVLHIDTGNISGTVALEAAYTHGSEWLTELMEYVEGNYIFLENFFHSYLPEVKVIRPEATFLVWLDFREYGMTDAGLTKRLVENAKVGLNNGARFGTGGEGFQRMNIGCPRAILKESLGRIRNAFSSIGTL